MNIKSNALIAQGGGPTAVINQSLVGAILEIKKNKMIENVYGSLYGINGIINENFIDLSLESIDNLEKISNTPGSALFSTRDKPNKEYCKKILNIFKKYNIHYFFYIGGNDSANTLLIINKYAEKEKYPFKAFHIPKTIDNDLKENDHTPGFGSAAKFIAEAFIGINFEIKSLPGIYIGVVMGRNAGFLAASSILAKKFFNDGPHLIYLPERPFNINKFIKDVKKIYEKLGICIVAISEGICDEKLIPISIKLKKNIIYDSHGNIELSGSELGEMLCNKIKSKLNIHRVRSDTFGYLQRSFISSISLTDSIEAREVGKKAVEYAFNKEYNNGSICIKRNKSYSIEYKVTKLENIAGKTKLMPNNFINKNGNNVTGEFLKYIKPIVGNDFREVSTLKFKKIKKIK